jgi:hypothetical protein
MTPPVAKSVQTSSVEHPAAQPESQRTSVAQNSAPAKTSAAHTLIVSQEIGSGHKLTTTKKRHSTRHWRHFRHRLHNSLMASIPVPAPAVLEMPVAEHIEKPFVFTVEGDVSLASFDTMTKTVDTYEGETFALNQAPSGSTDIAWQDNVPNIHYRCDQSGNCDLVRAGQAFLNSRRTK